MSTTATVDTNEADSGGEGAGGTFQPSVVVAWAARSQSLVGLACSLSAGVVVGNSEVRLWPVKVQPVGQPRANDHVSLHWTACYDDYCGAHRQMKDDNYYPQRGNDRRRRNHRPCSCPHAHPFELAEVIRNRQLNPRKACADWQ